MAEILKRGRHWYYRFINADGIRVMRKGCPDRRVTEQMAAQEESEAARARAGLIDPREPQYAQHAARPLADHLTEWTAALAARGATEKHVELHRSRAARVVALVKGEKPADIEASPPTRAAAKRAADRIGCATAAARLHDLDADRVQAALDALRRAGRSLATVNHHRGAIRSFARWLHASGRTRDDPLRGVRGYNAAEDRRHDRRTLAVDELRRLIAAAGGGPAYLGMSGPARALCYRLAVATGLRYGELGSLTRRSFALDARPPIVTVGAGAAKNGKAATLALPPDLVADLAPYLAGRPEGEPAFPLPPGKGADMLRHDLAAAGIAYRDDAGRVFDFHALRCQLATLLDLAGASPRVIQRLMRHSSLELSGRYTRPRLADMEAAVATLPGLAPTAPAPEAATGTAGRTHRKTFAPQLIHSGDQTGPNRPKRARSPRRPASSPGPGIKAIPAFLRQ